MLKLHLNAYFHNSFITMPYEIAKVGKVHHLLKKKIWETIFQGKGL